MVILLIWSLCNIVVYIFLLLNYRLLVDIWRYGVDVFIFSFICFIDCNCVFNGISWNFCYFIIVVINYVNSYVINFDGFNVINDDVCIGYVFSNIYDYVINCDCGYVVFYFIFFVIVISEDKFFGWNDSYVKSNW